MNVERSVVLYRRLLVVYPRRFKDEYAEDMALLFADQLRDERAQRVWWRGLVDLAITAPGQHLEARRHLNHAKEPTMNRPAPSTVPLLYAAVALGAASLAVLVGTNPIAGAVALAIAVVAGALAWTSWQRTRPVRSSGDLASRWWKLLVAGPALLGGYLLAATVASRINDDELPAGWWYAGTLVMVVAAITTLVGLVLAGIRMTSHSTTPLADS